MKRFMLFVGLPRYKHNDITAKIVQDWPNWTWLVRIGGLHIRQAGSPNFTGISEGNTTIVVSGEGISSIIPSGVGGFAQI